VGWSVVPIGADDHKVVNTRNTPDPRPAFHPPGNGGHERQEAEKLDTIIANQRRMLDLLNNVNTTLPDQQNVLGRILGLTNDIFANQALLLEEVGGLPAICSTADLVPLPVPGGGYCRTEPGNAEILHILVRNQGGGLADASKTQVFFRVPDDFVAPLSCGTGCAEVDIDTPALGSFATTDLVVAIPAACYGVQGICQFKIAVDATSLVAETDEVNNNVGGQCFALFT
jgi:hypothetical protein